MPWKENDQILFGEKKMFTFIVGFQNESHPEMFSTSQYLFY